ncbi:methylmalonyl-CoA mutase [Fibrella sp. HMF5335]|uniref:Methylmalonyl-CoA mutase n=1 Tax=Fibrella rubiginis TaxID=2817060 RepID=A0A939GMF0_9BACT|nr:methylmalonyl-CoA mutase family protein [Fibrella rubiginis]MBO0939495.1 methylmalonyl-CoA mutase [Fibrella rubiginis]
MPTSFSAQFSSATYADWRAQVQKDLKDANVYESLRWYTPEGFAAEPYYTAEQVSNLPLAQIQAAQKSTPGWLNAPFYTITDEKTDNATLHDALTGGAEALMLQLPANANLAHLLAGIKLSDTPVFFHVDGDVLVFLERLRQLAPYKLRGGIMSHHASLTQAIHLTADSPLFRTITIDGGLFHNAGATATQELAFTLAQLADVYDTLTGSGLSIDQVASKTTVSMAVGTSYFMEIAKLRALRVLWQQFIEHYPTVNYPGKPAQHLFLHTTTSPFHESTATLYTNLLRATTEAMAAVVGGCHALTVRPYDAVMDSQSEFSQRIARNVSVLLKAESYLDKVADPSAGSYYVESLTHQLTEAAWALFLQVESLGGYANAEAFIRAELAASYQATIQSVTDGKVLVGVTRFRHDEAGETKPISRNAGQSEGELTGLAAHRLAESFE